MQDQNISTSSINEGAPPKVVEVNKHGISHESTDQGWILRHNQQGRGVVSVNDIYESYFPFLDSFPPPWHPPLSHDMYIKREMIPLAIFLCLLYN
jgi:hypothetical protein